MDMPKSLHTVRALVIFAKELARLKNISQGEALLHVVALLGYREANDPHGVLITARKQLEA